MISDLIKIQDDKKESFVKTIIISVASVLVTGIFSFTQVYIQSLDKNKELGIQKLKSDKEMEIQQLKNSRELETQQLKNEADDHLQTVKLIFDNTSKLTSKNTEEQQLAIATLDWLGKKKAGEKTDIKNILSSIKLLGSEQTQKAATVALQQLENAKSEATKVWSGQWSHAFNSIFGKFPGEMKLTPTTNNQIEGTFLVKNGTVKGNLLGTLSSDGSTLTGNWSNTLGQKGKFSFYLNMDKKEFSGNYSLGDESPQKHLLWSGNRLTNV